MERLLVVQTAFLGDVVLTTPLVSELKRAHPNAKLTVLTTPLGRSVLRGHPAIDTLVAYDKKGEERGPLGLLRLVRRLRAQRFDAAVAGQRSSRTGLIVRGTGAPVRVGFAGAAGAWSYTVRVPWNGERHAVHRYLALAAPLGGNPETAAPAPSLAVLPEAKAAIEGLLREAGIGASDEVLSISPGSVWGTKRWTPEGFAAVAAAAPSLGVVPVLVGSPDEATLCHAIASLVGVPVPVLAGRTGIPELTALLARSRALLVNDSGPGHVASAVGTPVVAVFGPTVPAFGYTPYGDANRVVEHPNLECRPCDRHGPQVCPLGHHRCMKELPPERVIAALAEVLR